MLWTRRVTAAAAADEQHAQIDDRVRGSGDDASRDHHHEGAFRRLTGGFFRCSASLKKQTPSPAVRRSRRRCRFRLELGSDRAGMLIR